jgi:rhodanese-related sulfurtransferase
MMKFLSKLFGGGMPQIDIETYLEEYYQQNNHVLIDVRTAREFKSGHIPRAKNIALKDIGAKLQEIPEDKPVILVCQTGGRSSAATRTLMQAGYENVINLKGGTSRWQGLGHPVK